MWVFKKKNLIYFYISIEDLFLGLVFWRHHRGDRVGMFVATAPMCAVLRGFDQNGFRNPNKLLCFVCKERALDGEYQLCSEGCNTVFCDSCAAEFFVENKCCVLATSPTYPDRRQNSIVNYLPYRSRDVRVQPSREAKRPRL